MPGQIRKLEETEARACGILYTNIPMHGIGRPNEEQVLQALSLMENLPGPVFIHCQHGCDRTGTVIACYRIQHDHWTRDAAFAEARHYGISWFERGMKRFVMGFGRDSVRLAQN
jgi:protein tyrosine/serine phosphatase